VRRSLARQPRVLQLLEHQFYVREIAMSTASAAGWQPTTTRGNVARQIKAQRRGYARAVLRTLAHTQQHRPTAQTQRLLRDTLTPLGVRLPAATLHQLASDIAAGRPVDLT